MVFPRTLGTGPWTYFQQRPAVHSNSGLRRIVEDLTGRSVRVEFVHEQLAFTGEESPIATLMLSIMGAVAEFERALIRERQLEGIALAKSRGVYRGGWRRLSDERIAELRRRTDAGEEKSALAREFGISRQTLYRYLQYG
jgi:DNA invertase Pin-like site-specific DNA recombinase